MERWAGKHVGFVLFARSFGGAERRYLRLASFLTGHKIRVTLFCNPGLLKLCRQQNISLQGIEIVEVKRALAESEVKGMQRLLLRLLNIRGWNSMIRELQSSNLDHVHIVSNPHVLVLFLSFFRRRLPNFSFCIFGVEVLDSGKRMSPLEWLALRLGARAATRIDCLTPSYQNFAWSLSTQSLRERFVLAPCSFTDYSQVRIASTRDIDVLFLGRFVEGKGLALLGEIFSDLVALNLDVHVCGEGPLRGIAPGKSVYSVENPFPVLGRTKVFLSIQESENYPSQSLLEAMGSGCAIVATDVGNTRLLLDESNSILVPADGDAILGAIRKLMGSSELASKLGEKAKEKATKQFTIERYADYFVQEVLQF